MKRGEIWYVKKFPSYGCVTESGRPAIIVSNDVGNRFSDTVEVVYLTTKSKKPMPTHVSIASSRMPSTALCEQIHSVSKDLLTELCGNCSEQEMLEIDNAVGISIGLYPVPNCEDEKEEKKEEREIDLSALQIELRVYKDLCNQLLEMLNKTA